MGDGQRTARRSAPLLDDVRELVDQQLATRGRVGPVLPRAEEDVAADGERTRRHRAAECGCLIVGVHPDVVERIAERADGGTGEVAIERAPAPARSCDRGFDVGVHHSAGEDAIAVLHAGDNLREAAVADGSGESRGACVRRSGLRLLDVEAAPNLVEVGVNVRSAVLVHGYASICPPPRRRKLSPPGVRSMPLAREPAASGKPIAQVTDTVPALPGSVIEITPPHMHDSVQPACSAGCPSIITVVAPGAHGELVAGTQGAGVSTPSAAEVAVATAGFDGVPHIPNDGMFVIGANAWMFAAGVLALTGVPAGTTLNGTGTGGIAIEQVIIAPALTSGGTTGQRTTGQRVYQVRPMYI